MTLPLSSAQLEVLAPPADEVVEDDDLLRPALDELVDESRADRAGAAGDEHSPILDHAPPRLASMWISRLTIFLPR